MTQLAIQTAAPVVPGAELDIYKMGEVFAKSGFFTDAADPAKAIVKILAGRAMGIDAFSAMVSIHVIKGKPSVSAGLMAQKVKASAKYDYRVLRLDDEICELEFFENGQSVGVSQFTKADARKAGTQNVDKFARNMLFARCISNGVKWYCPDVFCSAVYTPEEMGAIVDGEGEVISLPAENTPRREAAPPKPHSGPDANGVMRCECGTEAAQRQITDGSWRWRCEARACRFDAPCAPPPNDSGPETSEVLEGEIADETREDELGEYAPKNPGTPESHGLVRPDLRAVPADYDRNGRVMDNGWNKAQGIANVNAAIAGERKPEPQKTERPPHFAMLRAVAQKVGLDNSKEAQSARLAATNQWRAAQGLPLIGSWNEILPHQAGAMAEAMEHGELTWASAQSRQLAAA